MVSTGTVAEWEHRVGMVFPETGQSVVPDALDPVSIGREKASGTYAQINLWMRPL